MAKKQPPIGGSTKKEKEAAKKRAWKKAQKKRKGGNYTPTQQLMDKDLKANEAKYVIQSRLKNKKKVKKTKPKKK